MQKTFLVLLCFFMPLANANAGDEFNFQQEVERTTEFPDCEEYVEMYTEFIQQYLNHPKERKFLKKQINYASKKLEKCEKRCKKKKYKTTIGFKKEIDWNKK
ncbi:MAG: hypothetical protein Q8L85_01750 [Alphaproteobacteria bacterium]|nr:hypothetical protein [Alphaproteobacteria bacterium]